LADMDAVLHKPFTLASLSQTLRQFLEPSGSVTPVATTTDEPAPAALSAPDGGAKRCARWLAINARIERLPDRWARLEGWLAREHGWFQLSPAEQQALPWAKELRDIDGCLDVLFEQRDAVLESLPTSGSVSAESLIAKLAVVERLIGPCDHPEAHALIARARRDLTAMSGENPHLVRRNSAS